MTWTMEADDDTGRWLVLCDGALICACDSESYAHLIAASPDLLAALKDLLGDAPRNEDRKSVV